MVIPQTAHSIWDRLIVPNGQTAYYTYDDDGNITALRYTGDTSARYEFVYDDSGNLAKTINHADNTVTVETESATQIWNSDETQLLYSYGYDDSGDYAETVNGETYGTSSATYYTTDDNGESVEDYSAYGTALTTGSGESKQEFARTKTVTDSFGRITSKNIIVNNNPVISNTYTYENISDTQTTNNISGITVQAGSSVTGTTKTLAYTYDNNGNISTVTDSAGLTKYRYDNLNQLKRVDDAAQNKTFVYSYTNGNLTGVKTYAYQTATTVSGDYTAKTYTYGDSGWLDKLTAVDGVELTYDGLGNPLSYYNGQSYIFTWSAGRQLSSAAVGANTYSYTYNENGYRTSKTNGTTTTTYAVDSSGNILAETTEEETIYYRYADGELVGLNYGGDEYFYLFNQQGDVIAITTSSGYVVANYIYDAWGRLVRITGAYQAVGIANHMRYRGYFYDTETKLYYLRSRYYDPQNCRFINADSIIGANQDALAYNIFAYCSNRPVIASDPTGTVIQLASKGKETQTIIGNLRFITRDYLTLTLDGKVKITKKIDNKTKQTGTELIRYLVGSSRTCWIEFYDEDSTHTDYWSTSKAMNGKGTNGRVQISRNPKSSSIYVNSPLFITLAHELIHAMHGFKGERIDPDIKASYTFNGRLYRSKAEELVTVGIVAEGYPKARITENSIRSENGFPLREYYHDEDLIPVLLGAVVRIY